LPALELAVGQVALVEGEQGFVVDECDKADRPFEKIFEFLAANYEREAFALSCAPFALSVGEGLAASSLASVSSKNGKLKSGSAKIFGEAIIFFARSKAWSASGVQVNLRLGLLSLVISDITWLKQFSATGSPRFAEIQLLSQQKLPISDCSCFLVVGGLSARIVFMFSGGMEIPSAEIIRPIKRVELCPYEHFFALGGLRNLCKRRRFA